MWLALVALVGLAVVSPLAAAQQSGLPVDDGHYTTGPGDILKVTVYGHEDLTQVVILQPDGTFAFPLVGKVAAEGKTASELQALLTELLSKRFLRNPQVAVVIQEVRSKQVFVVGEIARPGPYPLSHTTTLLEILARAGPLSAGASSEIVVVRPAGVVDGPTPPSAQPGAEVLRINLRALQSGDLSDNVVLRANDTVLVAQASRVYVSGEVRNPGAFSHAPGMTVRELIGLAGGFSADGSKRGLRRVRDEDGRARERRVRLEDTLMPGDTLIVKAKIF